VLPSYRQRVKGDLLGGGRQDLGLVHSLYVGEAWYRKPRSRACTRWAVFAWLDTGQLRCVVQLMLNCSPEVIADMRSLSLKFEAFTSNDR
jgi:hypothetical protein